MQYVIHPPTSDVATPELYRGMRTPPTKETQCLPSVVQMQEQWLRRKSQFTYIHRKRQQIHINQDNQSQDSHRQWCIDI